MVKLLHVIDDIAVGQIFFVHQRLGGAIVQRRFPYRTRHRRTVITRVFGGSGPVVRRRFIAGDVLSRN